MCVKSISSKRSVFATAPIQAAVVAIGIELLNIIEKPNTPQKLVIILNINSKIIVVKREDYRVGILVDQVTEVKSIDRAKIEMPSYITSAISSRYIKGIIKEENKIVILLSLESILTSKEKELIEQGI